MADKITPTTIATVTNLSSTDTYVFEWENERWKLPPGKSVIAPYFAICYWFGDPRAVDVGDPDASQHTQYRTLARNALSVRYGVYDHPWYTDDIHIARDFTDSRPETDITYVQRDGKFAHPNIPWVRVADQDGNQLLTVLDDPLGEHVTSAESSTRAEKKALESVIEDMQRQLAQLQIEHAMKSRDIEADPLFEGDAGGATDVPAVVPEARDTIPPPDQTYDHVNTDEIPADDALAPHAVATKTKTPPRRPTVDGPKG